MIIEKTLEERGNRYGTFENNAIVTQGLVGILLSAPSSNKLSPMHLEILHMICHKMSRMVCGDPFYVDNVHDIIGYAKGLENYLIKLQQEKDNAS